MKFPKTLKIKERLFKFISDREHQDVAIYLHKNVFLRIGSPQDIKREIDKHVNLAKLNFPVPTLVEQGKLGKLSYYVEKSLGKQHLGDIFSKEFKATGKISNKTFESFLRLTLKYAEAQLKTKTNTGSFKAFGKAVHFDLAPNEMPKYKTQIASLFQQAILKLKIFPFVLTHGDFCPHNLYPKGVIDFETQHYAPAGYDLVTNIFTITYFPKTGDYEFIGGYNFTKTQQNQYLKTIDNLYQQHGLPRISDYFKYFAFCRAMWHTARMHQYPKLQKFRYELFKQTYLDRNKTWGQVLTIDKIKIKSS